MIAPWELALSVVAMIAAAASAGAFFAFSNFVMPALARLSPPAGVSAMQAINVAAPTPSFVAAIVGAGLAGVPVAVAELGRLSEASVMFLLAGVVLSSASLMITVGSNVPRNNALARLAHDSVAADRYWTHYLVSWTRWNTARTVTSLASVGCYGTWIHLG